MRSIRGLYVRSKDRTWRIERISWSVSIRSQKFISIKVTGLSLELTPPIRMQRPSGSRRSPNPSIQLFKVLRSFFGAIFAAIPPEQAQKLRRLVGSIYREVLVNLVQTMNFEFDTVSISSSSFPGMEMTIGNLTFNSTIDFLSPSQNLADPTIQGRSMKRFSMAAARDLFTGRTDVAISLAVYISEIVGKTAIILPQSSDRRFNGLTATDNETVFLHAPGTLHSKLEFSYDLLTRGLSPDTVITSIHAPQCDVFLDRIILLLSSAPRDEHLPPPSSPSTMVGNSETPRINCLLDVKYLIV